MASLASLLCCCLCDDSGDESSETPDHLRPLLDRTPPSTPEMPRIKRTYGKKTTVAGTVAALAAPREPLAEIINDVAQLQLESPSGSTLYASSLVTEEDTISSSVAEEDLRSVLRETAGRGSEADSQSSKSLVDGALRPLIDAYAEDRSPAILQRGTWEEAIPEGCTITKIAEASFAEVYRVATAGGDSIVKIMRIRGSDLDVDEDGEYIGQLAEKMVSEFRIMNALTIVPGFVSFKDARVIRGKATQAIIDACQQYLDAHEADECTHPAPSTYTEDSLFLAMELGDAGMDLEHIVFSDISQVWDVFIGVVMALARAECEFEFEHRDLHENNICYTIKQPPPDITDMPAERKFGRSGVVITLIDYGLSRAKLADEDIIFCDLEEDLEIFKGITRKSKPTIQWETYRRMRTWLLSGRRVHEPRCKMVPQDDSSDDGIAKSWEESILYTNVLWIRYLLDWFKGKMKEDGLDQQQIRQFTEELIEFEKKLEPRTKLANAFNTAVHVLEFMVERGWVSEEQVQDYGFDASNLTADRTVTPTADD